MKTTIPSNINSSEEAETFLYQLWENGESFHPDDSAHDIVWQLPEEQKPTEQECNQLNELMQQIFNLENFDACQYLLDLDEEEERREHLARPNL